MTNPAAVAPTLEWVQPSWKSKVFELRKEGKLAASLVFPRWYKFEARHESPNGTWDIYQPRFFSQEVAIRQTGCELPYARFVPAFWRSDGTVELPKGLRLTITYRVWKNRYEVTREDGRQVFAMDVRGFVRGTGSFTLYDDGKLLDEYPWLTGLVWYLQLLRRRRAASGAH
jgi:hypothetical protein